MKKFSKIGQLAQLVRQLVTQRQFIGLDDDGNAMYDKSAPLGIVEFVSTVKLHGTNAGIRDNYIGNKELSFQSRENVISVEKDNAAFAFSMSTKEEALIDLFSKIRTKIEQDGIIDDIDDRDIIIFGEWAGKGIQKGVAVSELDKQLYIFDIQTVLKDTGATDYTKFVDMREFGNIYNADAGIYNLWDTSRFPQYTYTMDLENPALIQNDIVKVTDDIEACCPVGKHFGVEGIGEGQVLRVVDAPDCKAKVKGDKHAKGSKVKKTNIVDIEKINNVNKFVEENVNCRLEQAYDKMAELGHPYERSTIQHFVRWLINDILEEEAEAMQDAGLTPKDIGSSVGKKASRYFIERCEAL